MKTTSYIELSRDAMQNNVSFIRSLIGKDCKLSSVVKGNAYGHGIREFVPLALECGIDHFSVFSMDEAMQANEYIDGRAEIMVMGMIDADGLEWAIRNEISFFVFEPERLETAIGMAKKLNKPAKIHLEVETGMNRTGFTKRELCDAIDLIAGNMQHVRLAGMCTHYAGAESIANYLRVQNQIRSFEKTRKWMEGAGVAPDNYHTACSAAMVSYPRSRMNMVRIGIMQYGFWPSKETHINFVSKQKDKTDPLRRVISWKSKVMSTKDVKAGEFIGYGTTYMAESDMKIATVPVGYSHGYSRSLSNQGRIIINGHRISVIGKVNMSMLIADITNAPDVNAGDEVVLIGSQGEVTVSVASFSELSNQLNYELLTRLPSNIPRKIV